MRERLRVYGEHFELRLKCPDEQFKEKLPWKGSHVSLPNSAQIDQFLVNFFVDCSRKNLAGSSKPFSACPEEQCEDCFRKFSLLLGFFPEIYRKN